MNMLKEKIVFYFIMKIQSERECLTTNKWVTEHIVLIDDEKIYGWLNIQL